MKDYTHVCRSEIQKRENLWGPFSFLFFRVLALPLALPDTFKCHVNARYTLSMQTLHAIGGGVRANPSMVHFHSVCLCMWIPYAFQ